MMDKNYFMNAGIPPPQPLHFDTAAPPPWSGLNSTAEQSFLSPNSSVGQFPQFESALSSMVSSSTACSSGLSNDAFALRELIGKLGSIGSSTSFPPPARAASPFPETNARSSHDSAKLHLPILEQINMPHLGNSVAVTPPLASIAGDPGFAERAAKFSCFGSRSFNGRSSPLGLKNGELGHRSTSLLMGNGKLPRVSSTPSLKQPENKNLGQSQMETRPGNWKKLSNSNDESSVSEQIPSGETGSKTSNELNSRKRKAVSRGKATPAKGVEGDEDGNAKRSKPQESGKNETKTEEEAKEGPKDESEKQKTNQKPPEPPKDYIHVRARRGQATDSHSLAERVRREKISERMKLLQDLVPGCNKVTGKALMLDEIINYVQSLQRQVEFLSMKLASVNPGLDFNMENLLSKDMFQQNATLPQQMYPSDSSAPAFYHQNTQQNNTNISSGHLSHCSVDPQPLGIQLPSVDGFSDTLPQFPAFTEDDLHSIVQMGFVSFPVSNPTANMKVEP